MLGAGWFGAVDRDSSPLPISEDQFYQRNSAVAPRSGHWVAHFRSGKNNRLFYYDSFSEDYTHYFHDGARPRQSDPSDREQLSRFLGDDREQLNCGHLALTWLLMVK